MARRATADSRTGRVIMVTIAFLCALASITLLMALPAHAAVAAADPIDLHMRACLARADRSSTAGQVQCMNEAHQSWQTALENAYRQLLARQPHIQRRRWIISQHCWNAWYKAENPLLAAVFSASGNDALSVQSEADLRLQAVRDRVLILRAQIAPDDTAQSLQHPMRLCPARMHCERPSRELGRYYHLLSARLPAHARIMMAHAQRAWWAYYRATMPLINANARIDLIGARLATLKRLADTAGYR